MRTDTRHVVRIGMMLLLIVAGTRTIHAQQAAGITPDKATRVSAPTTLTVQSGSNFIRLKEEHLPATVTYVADTAFGPLPMALVTGDTLEAQMVFDTCHMAWRWSIVKEESDKIVEIKAHENASIFVDPYVCQVTFSDTTATACSSYEWRGQSYDESGDYSITLTNAAGCDSIRTLHLTIYTPHANTDTTATVWDSITWYGKKYTASGEYPITKTDEHDCDYTHTLKLTVHTTTLNPYEDAGCDSILYKGIKYTESGVYKDTVYDESGNRTITTMTFTVNHSTKSEDTKSACGSYEWNGTTYTESGDYTFKTTNVAGCDSLATLHLTIKKPTSSKEEKTACDSFEWHETTYTESGDYTYKTTNAAGCDSTVTLHLTINKSTSSEERKAVCAPYKWNGTTYSESGTYTYETTNAAGCDSVATLYLTVGKPTTGEDTKTACKSFEWNGTTYTESGTYTFHTTNVSGCDSTITLYLTIINDCAITYDTVYFCAGQNTEHEERVSSELIRRYMPYQYESPATWNYMEGVILIREKERMQVDLRRAEENLYTHYVDELTPVKSIRWSYRADGASEYRTLEVANEPQWVETGTIAVTVRFLCGQFYTSDFEADILMVNGENGANGEKVLENGQIIILRGGVKYNLFGLKIED